MSVNSTDRAMARRGARELSRQQLLFESFGGRTRLSEDLGVTPGDDITDTIRNAVMPDTLLVIDENGRYTLSGAVEPNVDAWGLVVKPQTHAVLEVPGGVDAAIGNSNTSLRKGLFGGFEFDGSDAGGQGRLVLTAAPGGHVDVLDVEFTGAVDGDAEAHAVDAEAAVGGTVRCERVTATDGGEADGIHVRPGTAGSVDAIDVEMAGFGSSGISMAGDEGAVHINGGSYRENSTAQVAFTGTNSWADGVEIRAETVSSAPGIRWVAGANHRQGGAVRNCEIYAHGDSPAVVGDEGAGPLSVETSNIETDGGGGVRAYTPAADKPSPWEVFDTDIVGDDDSYAIDIDEREGSRVEECCIHLPNGEGIRFEHLDPGAIVETRVNVGGTVWRHAQVEDCVTEGECPSRNVL